MADERDETEHSEDPTQKRLDEALERGDVVKSQEVNTLTIHQFLQTDQSLGKPQRFCRQV
jgi:flagellar biosynthesis protein FlhB